MLKTSNNHCKFSAKKEPTMLTSKDFENDSNQEKNPRKKTRKRISLTCTSCRLRKVKCDQKRPCSSCVKKMIPAHLCVYHSSPFVEELNKDPTTVIKCLRDENDDLKKEIDVLKHKLKSGIPESVSDGNTSDEDVELYDAVLEMHGESLYAGPTSFKTLLNQKYKNDELLTNLKECVKNAKTIWRIEHKSKFPDKIKVLTNQANTSNVNKLLKNLKSYLPDYKTLVKYLTLYSSSFWQFSMPILDIKEEYANFKEVFQKVDDNSDDYKIVIKKESDYSKLALLIMLFKFAATTLNHSKPSSESYDKSNILIQYISKLLSLTDSLPHIKNIQTKTLLFYFKSIDPTDDSSGDRQSSVSILKSSIQDSYQLGLNNNIDRLYAHESESKRQVLKNIWSSLINDDAVTSLQLGTPLMIKDEDLEVPACNGGTQEDAVINFVREAVKIISNPSKKTKLSSITNLISRIENYNDGKLVNLSDDIINYSNVDDITTAFNITNAFHYRVLSLSVIQILSSVALKGLDPLSSSRYIFHNSSFKYATLIISYVIELSFRINDQVTNNSASHKRLNQLVEVAISATAHSRPVFAHCYILALAYELELLRSIQFKINSVNLQKSYNFIVLDLEEFNPRDQSNRFHSLFNNPGFLHGLISLCCKYLLKLHGDSYHDVFKMNFFVLSIITVFKYADAYVNERLSIQDKDSLSDIKILINFLRDGGSKVDTCERDIRKRRKDDVKIENVISLKHDTSNVSINNVSSTTAINNTPTTATSIPKNGIGDDSMMFDGLNGSQFEFNFPTAVSNDFGSINPSNFTSYTAEDLELFDLKSSSIDKIIENMITGSDEFLFSSKYSPNSE